jgi:hypothetical protein
VDIREKNSWGRREWQLGLGSVGWVVEVVVPIDGGKIISH